jgi:rubredoxin/flavin reductase (DIM6/NTAB) family NADH-FMN oxidoreductase RutF
MKTNPLQFITYGMYIVSSLDGDRYNGQIANTLIQVTNDPVTIAISINKANLTHEMIMKSGLFSVSLLERDTPLKLVGKFGFKSGRLENKFLDTEYRVLSSGCPVVTNNSLCYFGARLINRLDCGSYSLFLGEVNEMTILKQGKALTYEHYHLDKCGTTPDTAPTFIQNEGKDNKCVDLPKYRCTVCNYVYNPAKGDVDGGIPPGTAFDDIPDSWVCPICGVGKSQFVKVDEE